MATHTTGTLQRLDREDGLTIIEVLVAALVLVAGSFATFGVLRTATVNNQRAKATQVALDRAQQEIEALRSLPNAELALTSTPPHSTDSLDPGYRVNESTATFALTRDPFEEPSPPYMVVKGGSLYGGGFVEGAAVQPQESFASGDVSGEIYRYVVWRNDASCGASCPGTQDFKQIVVAVKLDTPGNQSGERGYVEVQSDFVDPSDSAENDPIPPQGGQVNSPQQFFLSDTPCASAGETEREEWTERESHALHNTLGTCASGMQTGSTVGAPDALLLGSPPDPAPSDESNPPVYDYSDDYLGQITPETAKGIQLVPEDTGGCHFAPPEEGAAEPQWQFHRWVTDPMESKFTLTENATLDFFTRSLSDLSYKGTLCVYLFDRHEEGSPPEATNTALPGAEATYSGKENGQWPRNEWAEVRLPMSFEEFTIPKDDRLGIAISVDGNSDSGAIPVLYDHPDYRTRIEIETPTPLNAG
jgi:type II secretory pathway pseudopilin PulG